MRVRLNEGGHLKDKLMKMEEASRLVESGTKVAFGGFGVVSHPMALIYQLIRDGIKDLTALGWTSGNDVDILIGAGCVKRVEASYVGLEYLGLAPNFRRAVEKGEVTMVEYTEATGVDRFRAGAAGIPFFPALSLFGSDIPRVNPAIKEFTCPVTGERLHAVPAANPDVAVIHAPMADRYGNIVYLPVRNLNCDWDQTIAKASKRVIVTVERLVDHDFVAKNAHLNLIPRYWTDAVVEAPFGAHPSGFDCFYDTDVDHLKQYVEAGKDSKTFRDYLDRYVYGVRDHFDYLDLIGLRRLLNLRRLSWVGGEYGGV